MGAAKEVSVRVECGWVVVGNGKGQMRKPKSVVYWEVVEMDVFKDLL